MAEWSPFRAFIPLRKRRLLSAPDLCVLLILVAGGILLWNSARKLPQYDWQWSLLADFLVTDHAGLEPGLLLRGLFTTLRVGFWTFCFSLLLGGAIGIASTRRSLLVRAPCLACVNLARNTPPLVILFVVYFFAGNMLPVTPIEDAIRHLPQAARTLFAWTVATPGQLDRMLAAVLALGCYQAAYVAEIVRGGISAIPTGQWDAARALGFGRAATIRLVILPQAALSMLPPLTGQCISTFKDSALASLISLPDLTFQSLEIMAVSGMTFETWISAAALYLLIGLVCAIAGHLLEKKYTIHLK